MAKTIATILGVVFILVGIVGFFVGPTTPMMPNFLGTHLSTTHNLVHIISGAISLYFGLAGTLGAAKTFDIVFGVVYALLGVCGFLLGSGPDRMFDALGSIGLHLGTMDHVVHILLGVVFLIGGFLTRADARVD
ncbi:MAG TPA: DUF4383 domain-containing protein [Pyrinomonadaceae bacterium]|nr:DUF4383 domain-containing protein [Pyrinomonadaceae bacterium]